MARERCQQRNPMGMMTKPSPGQLSPRKETIRAASDAAAPDRRRWRERHAFFHEEDLRYLSFLVPPGSRVLEIGCGTGDLLTALKPSFGVGVDISSGMIDLAKSAHGGLEFVVGDAEDPAVLAGLSGPFDAIIVVDTIGQMDDVQGFLESLHSLCHRETRVIIGYFSHLWLPVLKLAESTGQRAPLPDVNVLSAADVKGLAELAEFEFVKSEYRLLSPARLLGLGRVINRFLTPFPVIRNLALRHYTVCRSLRRADPDFASATVVVPARNEKGNIEAAITRIPRFCDDLEIIFVEGHSKDGTWEEIERVQSAYPQYDIKIMRQPGVGKADAVFHAFEQARGDVLIILDADLTMPPEQLPKFWKAIASGRAEFVNGSRLVYPMENQAMRFLNLIANKSFSYLFSWLLNQRLTDTLCGTKVISRADYARLKAGRSYFGDFDPFGDFDLIFGAAKLNLKIQEVPVRYASRSYGETQISRFRHGVMLLRMVVFAFFRIKAL
ncbi:MAG: glycosyltransferase [Novosphingobium sp.]|uniref:glycosyltransferase n=1 Tax=Novosphingobium sp. TaxID=1874826 RepID=UPI0022C2B954|nr:glycosyltransferase [Novosphingobium sp.]MCZ8036138.1 glycosyltransferase [Novosphingobium sp.]